MPSIDYLTALSYVERLLRLEPSGYGNAHDMLSTVLDEVGEGTPPEIRDKAHELEARMYAEEVLTRVCEHYGRRVEERQFEADYPAFLLPERRTKSVPESIEGKLDEVLTRYAGNREQYLHSYRTLDSHLSFAISFPRKRWGKNHAAQARRLVRNMSANGLSLDPALAERVRTMEKLHAPLPMRLSRTMAFLYSSVLRHLGRSSG